MSEQYKFDSDAFALDAAKCDCESLDCFKCNCLEMAYPEPLAFKRKIFIELLFDGEFFDNLPPELQEPLGTFRSQFFEERECVNGDV